MSDAHYIYMRDPTGRMARVMKDDVKIFLGRGYTPVDHTPHRGEPVIGSADAYATEPAASIEGVPEKPKRRASKAKES